MDDAPSCGDKGADEFPARVVSANGPCINAARCGAAKSFAESRQRLMCRACFADAVMHQFRRGLQLVKPVKRSGTTPLVVAFSGGVASSALLDMCARLLQQDARKVHFSCHVVWIDCLDVLPVSPEQAQTIRADIAAAVEKRGFESFRRIPLCAAFSRGSLAPDEQGSCMVRLKHAFGGSRPMVSWKEALLDVLVRSLLIRYAQSVDSHRVVVGDTMTRMSVKLFGSLSRGVGSNAGSLVSPVDAVSFGPLDVMIVRPLSSMTSKELGLYNRAVQTADIVVVPSFSTQALDKKHSLDLLSETFLLTLQDAHDHTLPTLVRAANKIDPADDTYFCKEWAHCMGCDPELKKVLQARSLDANAALAARCQLCLLVKADTQSVGKGCCQSECASGCGDKPQLCRKCTLLTSEMEAENGTKAAEVAVSYRDEVRAKIADYLLSSDDDEDGE